jgi:hypothetical protein
LPSFLLELDLTVKPPRYSYIPEGIAGGGKPGCYYAAIRNYNSTGKPSTKHLATRRLNTKKLGTSICEVLPHREFRPYIAGGPNIPGDMNGVADGEHECIYAWFLFANENTDLHKVFMGPTSELPVVYVSEQFNVVVRAIGSGSVGKFVDTRSHVSVHSWSKEELTLAKNWTMLLMCKSTPTAWGLGGFGDALHMPCIYTNISIIERQSDDGPTDAIVPADHMISETITENRMGPVASVSKVLQDADYPDGMAALNEVSNSVVLYNFVTAGIAMDEAERELNVPEGRAIAKGIFSGIKAVFKKKLAEVRDLLSSKDFRDLVMAKLLFPGAGSSDMNMMGDMKPNTIAASIGLAKRLAEGSGNAHRAQDQSEKFRVMAHKSMNDESLRFRERMGVVLEEEDSTLPLFTNGVAKSRAGPSRVVTPGVSSQRWY